MESVLVTGYLFLFLALIKRLNFYEVPSVKLNWIQAAFVLKVVAGIVLGLIYTYYYTDRSTADTFKFYDDGLILFSSLRDHPADFLRMFTGLGADDPGLHHYYERMYAWENKDIMFNDNKTIIRMNALFRFFSLGYYYVHVVFINFISFTGLFFLYKTFYKYVPGKTKELFILIFFLPSVLFWGSGLLKDGLLLFALGGLIYSFSKIADRNFKIKYLLLFFTCLTLLMFTKIYALAILVPGMIAWFFSFRNSGKKILLKFILIYLVYLIAAFNFQYLFPKYNLVEIFYWKQKNFLVQAQLTNAHSFFQIPPLEMSLSSIVKNSPLAFCNALFRPTVLDAGKNPLILLSALENILLLIVMILSFISLKKESFKIQAFPVLSGVFVILMFVLIGLTTPILGALVRYKISALPFLVFILVYLYDREKLLKRVPLLKKLIQDK